MTSTELPRKLEFTDALAIVVGVMIGSGIFLTPSSIAQTLPSPAAIAAVWVFAGIISLFGALAFAELCAMMPDTGGQYTHLREAFGPLCAFLFGWALFTVIRAGGTATLAVGFSIYLGHFVPMPPAVSKAAAVAVVLIFTCVNYRGVRLGAGVQRLLTLLKVLGVIIVIAVAFASPRPPATDWAAEGSGVSLSSFGVAMIACLWAYQGWFAVCWVAGEVKRPGRNLPLSLGLGVGAVMALYVAANLAYMKILPVAEIARTERVAATVTERALGPAGATLVSLTILISIAGAINGGLLAAPRVYFAQARDGLFFRKFASVHPRFETPAFSILATGLWASLLAASGSYQKLFSYVIFTSWIFYGLTVAAVFVLRRKYPDLPRPYKTWGYPVTPLIFILVTIAFVANSIVTTPGPSLMGLGIVASGIPIYLYWRRDRQPGAAAR